MQLYSRIYDYITEYWHLIYEVYAKHGIAYLCNYYHINSGATTWDDENLMSGPYEFIGQLSGVRWNKILLLPLYYITETSTNFDAKEEGYVNEGEVSFVIPSDYGLVPGPGDIIKLDQRYLDYNPAADNHPIYMVGGVKKQSTQEKSFWQLQCTVFQSRTVDELDLQVDNTTVFYDYDKKIHSINDSVELTKILNKYQIIRDNLARVYDENSGFYLL